MDETEHYLNVGEKIIIDGKEQVVKALGTTHYGNLIKIMKVLEKKRESKDFDPKRLSDILDALDGEGIEAFSKMVADTIRNMFPEDDEDFHNHIAMQYMSEIWPAVMTVNFPQASENTKARTRLAQKMKNGITKPSKK